MIYYFAPSGLGIFLKNTCWARFGRLWLVFSGDLKDNFSDVHVYSEIIFIVICVDLILYTYCIKLIIYIFKVIRSLTVLSHHYFYSLRVITHNFNVINYRNELIIWIRLMMR